MMARSVTAVLAFVAVALCALDGIAAQFINADVLGQSNAVQVKVTADDSVRIAWNGEWLREASGYVTTSRSILIPVNKCNFPNVLAFKFWGNQKINDGFIFTVTYGNKTYASGKSSEVYVTGSYQSANWHTDANIPSFWIPSYHLRPCKMLTEQMEIRSSEYRNEAEWIWADYCTNLHYSDVYAKLIIPTYCDVPATKCAPEETVTDEYVITKVLNKIKTR